MKHLYNSRIKYTFQSGFQWKSVIVILKSVVGRASTFGNLSLLLPIDAKLGVWNAYNQEEAWDWNTGSCDQGHVAKNRN